MLPSARGPGSTRPLIRSPRAVLARINAPSAPHGAALAVAVWDHFACGWPHWVTHEPVRQLAWPVRRPHLLALATICHSYGRPEHRRLGCHRGTAYLGRRVLRLPVKSPPGNNPGADAGRSDNGHGVPTRGPDRRAAATDGPLVPRRRAVRWCYKRSASRAAARAAPSLATGR